MREANPARYGQDAAADRIINMADADQLCEWADSFGVTATGLKEAVSCVGPSVRALEIYLGASAVLPRVDPPGR